MCLDRLAIVTSDCAEDIRIFFCISRLQSKITFFYAFPLCFAFSGKLQTVKEKTFGGNVTIELSEELLIRKYKDILSS